MASQAHLPCTHTSYLADHAMRLLAMRVQGSNLLNTNVSITNIYQAGENLGDVNISALFLLI